MTPYTNPAGTVLTENDLEQRVLTVMYHPRAKYAWATGVAISKFLGGLKEGRILGTKCDRCGRIVVPPRIFCEYCFRPSDNYLELPDTGIVNTYSVSHISTDTTRLQEPIIPAVIEIDGTDRAGFLHILGEINPDRIRIGMKVRAVWKPHSERRGSITDILHFKPQGE